MFNKKTVLVLGAGASSPFGFPLGETLLSNIIDGLKSLSRASSSDHDIARRIEKNFISQPYLALSDFLNSHPHTSQDYQILINSSRLTDLAQKMAVAGQNTIDAFARANPKQRKLIKLLTALEISRCTFCPRQFQRGVLRPNPKLFENSRKTWYGQLASHIKHQCNNAEELENNNEISIVTFNYDQSLEIYLEREIARDEIFVGARHEDIVPIVHVHGTINISDYDKHSYSSERFGNTLMTAADQFVMVDEPRDQKADNAMVAATMLRAAERIIIFGFDLAPENCELIKLKDPSISSKIYVLNWDGAPRVKRRAAAIGVPDEQVLNGSNSRPLEIVTAIHNEDIFNS